MNKIKLSAVISAYNEESKIKECLESLIFADEIIFVDNESTDKTVQIAKKYTNKIYTRKNNLMLNSNKNYGISKATGEWILLLDADEQVTDELKDEIKKTIEMDSEVQGYWIPRKNIIFGKWIQSEMWSPDFQLRLFKNGSGKFPEKHVHEYIEIKGETKKLSQPLLHYNYQTISQFIRKLDTIYTENEVEQFLSSGKSISWVDAIRFPCNDFMKTFFAQKGYRDGLHGLVLSILQAFYAEVVFAKIWERKGFMEYTNPDFINQVDSEFSKKSKEFIYWIATSKIATTNSSIQKIMLRLKRKLQN